MGHIYTTTTININYNNSKKSVIKDFIYTHKVDIVFLQEFVAEFFDNFPGIQLYTT